MSFKNLEERYNETADSLYAAAKNKYDGGVKSTGINDDPLITRRVGDESWGFGENRSTPVRSSLLDVQRLTKFYISQRGLLAYGKQQLLQTGNTFEFTRLLNPTFAIGNAVPFLHIRRHVNPRSPLSGLVGKTDASTAPVKEWGQMQVSSYNELKAYSPSKYLVDLGLGKGKTPESLSLREKFKAQLESLNPLNGVRNIGVQEDWNTSRPELAARSITSYVDKFNARFQTATDNFIREVSKDVPSYKVADQRQPFLKYFQGSFQSITSRFDVRESANAKTIAESARQTGQIPDPLRRISYIKDPINLDTEGSVNVLERYRTLNATEGINYQDDIIITSFAMGNDDHVQFRSFIRDLEQSANPEYTPYQYVGRIEKFIYYKSVEREVSFALDLIAFSKDELSNVWNKINYFTSMVYPYGINRGILQPNIIRMTIGNVYVNQPMYITSLRTSFNQASESWDIDSEVPIAATMNVSCRLIEKDTKTANKPFYGITEGTVVAAQPARIQQPDQPTLPPNFTGQAQTDLFNEEQDIESPGFPPPPAV